MDMDSLNKIARGGFLPTKKVTELKQSHLFMVTALRIVNTKKFGRKIVANLDDEFQIFLPERVSTALLKDEPFLDSLMERANKMDLFVKYNGDHLEFVD